MLLARIVPVAPFAVVNLVAGAIQIRLRDFLLGTVIGMSPGIFALVMLQDQIEQVLRDPATRSVALLAGLAIFYGLLGGFFYRWYSRRRARPA
jgi:uncharacterized membrane protein YdjX (TVP38/TMEM64 family)